MLYVIVPIVTSNMLSISLTNPDVRIRENTLIVALGNLSARREAPAIVVRPNVSTSSTKVMFAVGT